MGIDTHTTEPTFLMWIFGIFISAVQVAWLFVMSWLRAEIRAVQVDVKTHASILAGRGERIIALETMIGPMQLRFHTFEEKLDNLHAILEANQKEIRDKIDDLKDEIRNGRT